MRVIWREVCLTCLVRESSREGERGRGGSSGLGVLRSYARVAVVARRSFFQHVLVSCECFGFDSVMAHFVISFASQSFFSCIVVSLARLAIWTDYVLRSGY
jgi:hypothetical protein